MKLWKMKYLIQNIKFGIRMTFLMGRSISDHLGGEQKIKIANEADVELFAARCAI